MESIFEEKHDEEEGELRKWETTDKKTKYIKNAHGQTKLKVSAPLTIQKKVITSVKEKIEKKENITWEDFARIQGNRDQLSTLIGLVLHKTITYQANYRNTYPDRIFDYLKNTNKSSLLKALNDESYFYEVIDYIELKLARGPGKLTPAFTKQTGESYSLPYYLDLDLFPSFEWHFKQQTDDENIQKPSAERTVH